MNIHILIRIFIENINKLKLRNGGHKMTAVSKEIQPLDNGGRKMTTVSKEIKHQSSCVSSTLSFRLWPYSSNKLGRLDVGFLGFSFLKYTLATSGPSASIL